MLDPNVASGEGVSFPEMIDFAKIKPMWRKNPKSGEDDSWVWNLGYLPFEQVQKGFNMSPEMHSFFYFVKRHYQIDVAVETGTHRASTTLYLSAYFKEVHSIENYPQFFSESKEYLKNCNNVHLYLESSQSVLNRILPDLQNQRVFFYLDAHGYQYWPLLDELDAISKTHKDNCIIVVDDCKVPGRDDITYDQWENISCSYEFFKDNLQKVFTEYTHHYVIPEHVNRRARFMAIPKKWASSN